MTQRLLDRTYSLNPPQINPNDISVDEEDGDEYYITESYSASEQNRRFDLKHDMRYSEMVGNYSFINQYSLLRLLARGSKDSNKPFSR